MIQQLLLTQLDRVAARYRLLRFWQTLAVVWLAAALAGGALWFYRAPLGLRGGSAALLLGVSAALLAGYVAWRTLRDSRGYAWIARRVESAFPELQSCLLAAVEQQPESPSGKFGYLQSSVIRQALHHAHSHNWPKLISQQKLLFAALANVFTFALFAVALVGLALSAAKAANLPLNPLLMGASQEFALTIEPGDTEIEKGTSLLVLARIQGPLPPQATLIYQPIAGEELRLVMSPSLNDPIFGARIPIVDEPLEYYVSLGERESSKYRIKVFEYPRLERADANLVFPTYTKQEPRLVQDVRTVSVVQGTELTLRCTLNKPVVTARLVSIDSTNPSEPIALTASESAPLVYSMTLRCETSQRWKLELIDDAGRQSVKAEQFRLHVLPNQPPSLKPIFPARDLEVSALQEIDLKASAQDDFGVERIGITYSLAGQSPTDVVIFEQAAGKQKHEVAHALSLEALKAEPDQLLSYHWWVEDFDAQGEVRRTLGDMYFAEVRPFEEIFRQGEQPPGGEEQQRQQQQQNQQGQSQNAQDAQQLGKLQKDIINATWKLIRREITDKLTASYAEDVAQVQASQASALEQAEALGERLEDEQSQAHLETVLTQMQLAVAELTKAESGPAREPLTPALAAEQAAYQGLLKLRAREHEVVRQQQQQQGQQSSQQQQSNSRSQEQREQLNQLDLREEQNRYETERQAQEQQQETAQERENRQVLNRLRELAQRQHDLNERLKELQSALEEAPSPQEAEEIRQQLKRLQDEQREILQDTDELQARMEQPENQEQMTEQRQQLDDTRDQVRRASEALQEERVTQAAAAGTRAEQQFDELREEFRRRASDRFQEEVQNLRQAARDLDEREEKIGEQIREAEKPMEGAPTLREDNRREEIAQELAEQRQRLGNLQEAMRDTIERAEATEPILSQRLYDTARELRDQQIEKALQATERSVRQGLPEDAQRQEALANEGLKQLREGIERAAEGVIGDETEALRRAREELQELSRELRDEAQRNQPREPQAGERQPGEAQPMEGERANGQGQQPGEGREPMEGQQPGQGREPMEGQQPGEGQPPGQGQQPINGQEPMRGQQSSTGQQPGNGQPMEGQQPGQGRQPMNGQQPGEGQQSGQGQPMNGQQPGQRQQPGQQTQRGGSNAGGATGPFQDYVPGQAAPLTGENFREWSDRLRDVEEMVDDPELRSEAARIRERARGMRMEVKRHSAEPNWDLVQEQLLKPLAELEDRVSEELLRRTAKKAIVPLDRDPVPPQYSEKTRRYYERLGSGK